MDIGVITGTVGGPISTKQLFHFTPKPFLARREANLLVSRPPIKRDPAANRAHKYIRVSSYYCSTIYMGYSRLFHLVLVNHRHP